MGRQGSPLTLLNAPAWGERNNGRWHDNGMMRQFRRLRSHSRARQSRGIHSTATPIVLMLFRSVNDAHSRPHGFFTSHCTTRRVIDSTRGLRGIILMGESSVSSLLSRHCGVRLSPFSRRPPWAALFYASLSTRPASRWRCSRAGNSCETTRYLACEISRSVIYCIHRK
jgi:hypothetical protein